MLPCDAPDLRRHGELVMGGEFAAEGKHLSEISRKNEDSKNRRILLIFEKMCLLLKRHRDRLEVKMEIPTNNLIVFEGAKTDLTFGIAPFHELKTKVRQINIILFS